MPKKNYLKAGLLGGAIGGLISCLISSPQSQWYWWNKEPTYRWNIVLWDSIAGMAVCGTLYWFTKNKKWLYLAGGIGAVGGALTVMYHNNPNFPNPLQASSIEQSSTNHTTENTQTIVVD